MLRDGVPYGPRGVELTPTSEPPVDARAGMATAFERGYDVVWFVDDDTTPDAQTLARTLDDRSAHPDLGMLGQLGGTLQLGIIRHGRDHGPVELARDARQLVDFVLTDGAVVTRAAYERVGVLDERYFIMMEDVEYPLRVKRAGLVVAHADLGLAFHHLGATDGRSRWARARRGGSTTRPGTISGWRSTPAVRPSCSAGCTGRSAGSLYLIRQPDRRRERLRYRWRGTVRRPAEPHGSGRRAPALRRYAYLTVRQIWS